MDQFSRPSLRKAVSELAKYSLLQRSDRRQSATESALAAWQYWNPAAGFFHLSTKDMRYTFDPVEEESYLRRWAQKFPMPSSTKHYPRARKFPLLAPNTAGEFPNVLLARRTWRQFSQEPVELCTLSTLLGLTFGIQQWVDFLGLGRLPLKTSFRRSPASHRSLCLGSTRSRLASRSVPLCARQPLPGAAEARCQFSAGNKASCRPVLVRVSGRASTDDGCFPPRPVEIPIPARLSRGPARRWSCLSDVLPGSYLARPGAILFNGPG